MADHIIRNEADRRRLVAFLQGLNLSKPHPEDLMMAIYGERQAA